VSLLPLKILPQQRNLQERIQIGLYQTHCVPLFWESARRVDYRFTVAGEGRTMYPEGDIHRPIRHSLSIGGASVRHAVNRLILHTFYPVITLHASEERRLFSQLMAKDTTFISLDWKAAVKRWNREADGVVISTN
jgi:hypothetical protein